jgi:hypothetical protein
VGQSESPDSKLPFLLLLASQLKPEWGSLLAWMKTTVALGNFSSLGGF